MTTKQLFEENRIQRAKLRAAARSQGMKTAQQKDREFLRRQDGKLRLYGVAERNGRFVDGLRGRTLGEIKSLE